MTDKIKMRVEMEVTKPQAVALQAMFTYWNQLSSMGSSRNVTFFVDGDGNFHPKCDVSFSKRMPLLTSKIAEMAVVEDNDGNRKYDYDLLAWKEHDDKD
jgi:hypothetical protein